MSFPSVPSAGSTSHGEPWWAEDEKLFRMSPLPLEVHSVGEDEGGRCSGREREQGLGASGDRSVVTVITHCPTLSPHSGVGVALNVTNEAAGICWLWSSTSVAERNRTPRASPALMSKITSNSVPELGAKEVRHSTSFPGVQQMVPIWRVMRFHKINKMLHAQFG